MAERKKRENFDQQKALTEIERLIEHHKKCIANLEEKKTAILNRKANPNAQMKKVMGKVKDLGLSAEEIAEKLGITLDE